MPLSQPTLQMPLRGPPLNLIKTDPDDPAAHRYPLHLQNALAATAPRFYAKIKPCYVDALHILLSQEKPNAVINKVTGQSLYLRQLL